MSDLQLGPRVQLGFLSPNFAPNRLLPSDRMWEESNRSCLFASDRLVWSWLVLAMQFPNALPYLWNTWSRKFKICAPRSPLFEFILLIFLIPAQIRVNRLYLWVQLKLVKNKNECKPITPDRVWASITNVIRVLFVFVFCIWSLFWGIIKAPSLIQPLLSLLLHFDETRGWKVFWPTSGSSPLI